MPPNEYEVAIPNRQFLMVAAPLFVMMSLTSLQKAHDDHKYKINLSYTNPRRQKDYGNVITGKGA